MDKSAATTESGPGQAPSSPNGWHPASETETAGASTEFEYGILLGEANALHRSDMTAEEAETWLVEWVQMTGRKAPFRIARRPVGEWEPVE